LTLGGASSLSAFGSAPNLGTAGAASEASSRPKSFRVLLSLFCCLRSSLGASERREGVLMGYPGRGGGPL
jgi:hypothetical protein